MLERTVELATRDGESTTFIVHPDREGPHPVILFYMDAPAIREELRDMARRLATSGYYVMLPNLYYRSGVLEIERTPDAEAFMRKMRALMESLTTQMIMEDTDALIAFADQDPAAKPGPMGCVGYCMSGPFAINAAARAPHRMRAAASIYGVRLETEAADSPHLALSRADAEFYVACAERDHWAPPEMIAAFKKSFAASGARGEVEDYPDTDHGFAFPQRPVYNKAAAERHWSRLLSLYRRTLS